MPLAAGGEFFAGVCFNNFYFLNRWQTWVPCGKRLLQEYYVIKPIARSRHCWELALFLWVHLSESFLSKLYVYKTVLLFSIRRDKLASACRFRINSWQTSVCLAAKGVLVEGNINLVWNSSHIFFNLKLLLTSSISDGSTWGINLPIKQQATDSE